MQNTIYYNKSQEPYVILGLDHKTPKNNFWKIQFIQTGYQTVVTMGEVKRGNIRDYYVPAVAGIGFMGDCVKTKKNWSTTRAYRVWHNMINRCYNPQSTEWHHYGARGVTVCKRWHNFSNFLTDLPFIPGYVPELLENNQLHLDKDGKQRSAEHKQYSPETTQFVTPLVNTRLSDKKRRAICATDPKGEPSTWESVSQFIACYPKFSASTVYRILAGRSSHCQGWKFDYCNDYRKPINDGVSRVAMRETRIGEVQSI